MRGRLDSRRYSANLISSPLAYMLCSLVIGITLGHGAVVLASEDITGDWKPLESVRYIWRRNQPAYQFAVEETPRAPPRLRIQDPYGGALTITLDGGVVPIAQGVLNDHALIAGNLIKSKYIYISRKLRNVRGEPMLIIFGWGYASDPGSIRIISLNSNGAPHILFSSQTFLLTGIVSLKHGRDLEIIGLRSMSQQSGCLETYNPYIVYRLSLPRGTTFTYSEASSRKYNNNHYFGWDGPKATQRIAVVLCKRGHGRILPWTEAERLYNQ